MRQTVITAVGPDRPGIVHDLTGRLELMGANIADSRMVNLRGQFALILLVESPDDLSPLVDAGLAMGLQIALTPQPDQPRISEGLPYRLRTFGMDRPGIVHQITNLLHAKQANIETLETHLQSKSYNSPPVFKMDLLMTLPASVSVGKLRQELEDLCETLNCDLELEPARSN